MKKGKKIEWWETEGGGESRVWNLPKAFSGNNNPAIIDFLGAHCTDSAQNQQKIVSKSWFTYPIWTIGTYKVVLVDQESTVKTSNHI